MLIIIIMLFSLLVFNYNIMSSLFLFMLFCFYLFMLFCYYLFMLLFSLFLFSDI